MLALYRSGRQAEALEVYQDARSTLVEELGIEPGRELRDLHQKILNQDPGLDLGIPTTDAESRAAKSARRAAAAATHTEGALASPRRALCSFSAR